jgi:CheY-like chemotaxis protein
MRYFTETGGVDMSEKYILVVDDDPDLVETVAMMLESKGCEVGRAYDGVEGEESIRKRRPDLVILDVMMPRKDGYQLCAELKADEATRSIPIVLLTAVGEAVPTTSYTHADGMSTEADEYIAKPIDTESMWNIVNSLI